MKKAVVIGGKGKIGGYLVPMLVKGGYDVTCVSRGRTEPHVADSLWKEVRLERLERGAEGFEEAVGNLRADVVADMVCFRDEDMRRLIRAINGSVSHYLACGSVWMHGRGSAVPYEEGECRAPLEEYGAQKSLMDLSIASLHAESGFPGTVVHPGHIVCPGDVPINPQGCKSLGAFRALKAGEPLHLPNFGMETLHHVYAGDVAGVFYAAIVAGAPAFGQGFHAVSPRAVTLRGYAEEAAGWYGREANLRFEPFGEWRKRMSDADADATLSHISHSPSASMGKAKRILGFEPRYTSYEAVRECLAGFGL
ncbi:MAG: NAD-dependent epimerase/dehydratase family protein [Clostridiales bacterium]|nr:NAD-dependent epimerase/dehydratase family protein [Clostridiales bacterium]